MVQTYGADKMFLVLRIEQIFYFYLISWKLLLLSKWKA